MWRAALVGLLVTAAASCGKKTQDGPAVVTGATVGTVIEVSGQVSVAGKPLAKGDTVTADDVVDVAATGHVAIELAHNHARWTLDHDKHAKARDSLAWGLAKAEGSAAGVDQVATSAGRNGERSAAETDVTTATRADPAPAPATATTAEPPQMQPGASNRPLHAEGGGGAHGAAMTAPPPPPPPSPKGATSGGPIVSSDAKDDRSNRDKTDDLVSAGGKVQRKESAKVASPPPPPPDVEAHRILVGDDALRACVKSAATAHLSLICTDTGCVLAATTARADAACFTERIGRIAMPKGSYKLELELTAPAH